jgi:DNA repair exonuclease SbcCD nuclease subunit
LTVKILLTGDNHLNYYSQKLGSKIAERRSYMGRCWWETIEYAVKNKADLYLNVGDFFDQTMPRNPPRAQVVRGLMELKGTGVRAFVIAGNHDSPSSPAEGASPHRILSEAGLATVFEDVASFGQEMVKVGGLEVSIAGMSYDKRLSPGMDPLEGLEIPGGGDINIAMLHYSVEKLAPSFMVEPLVKVESIRRNQHIDLYAMGHPHNHIETVIGRSHIKYPGATERMDFGEWMNETGFLWIEVGREGIRSNYIRTRSQPMNRIALHTSKLDRERPTEQILRVLEENSDPEGLLQLVLEGELDLAEYMNIDFVKIAQKGEEGNFFFEYLDKIIPTIKEYFEEAMALNPEEELVRRGKLLIERASGDERRLWERALQIAQNHYERRRMGGG